MISQITNHKEQARNNLISQYKDSTNFISIIDSFNTQTQDLENAIYELIEGRWIENASGQVLDDFGTIVGQERLGFDDEFYKILLYVKMGENVSQGETERVISIYNIITQATRTMLQEHFPAGMILLSDGEINPITASFVLNRLQTVVGAGIRIDQIGKFDPDAPFGFQGVDGVQGYRDINGPNVGGTYAYLYDAQPKFSYTDLNGNLPSGDIAGYGILSDHILGGKFNHL